MRLLLKQFFKYFWGVVNQPGLTFVALAKERSVVWGLAAASLGVLQVWGNILLHTLFGLDWLGTHGLLNDPTFVAGFGYWRVDLANFVPFFAALMPFFSLLEALMISGVAHLLSKIWHGQATFEQMFNALAFASVVPNIVIAASTEWIFGVPVDLLSGHSYWWKDAMQGQFGAVSLAWNFYMYGIYLGLQYVWIIALGSMAIRRIQRIPTWAAVLTMLFTFIGSMLLTSVFVR